MDKVTVIIPTYNRPQFFRESLESILSQTLKPWQLIVINNGPTPDIKEICNSYSNVEYYEIEARGKSYACNFGLQYTKGEYLWIFDDDDIAAPEALEKFVEPLRNSEYDFSYSPFWKIKNDIDHPLGLYRIPYFKENEFFSALLKENFISGASLFARTECYRQAGGFNPELIRSQDYDLAIRIGRKFKGIKIDFPTYYHREHHEPRGFGQHSFDGRDKNKKWLEYDQMIFRRLYQELDLYEYA
jgi:glycosyltransferase involved in cell wall biosynthesis